MSGSHFIVQTSKFMLINATATTLGQGHGKVIQYISPDPYNLCAKYLRFSWNSLMWEAKVVAAAGAEMNWKHNVTPDRGDLMRGYVTYRWLGVRLQSPQCISNGVTAVLLYS